MTKLYLIRHAEAEGNLYRRIHGQYDSILTENGQLQLEALRGRFAEIQLDAVYASDLTRARWTAQAICAGSGLQVQTRADLREVNLGVWEDRPWAEIERNDPSSMELFRKTSKNWLVEGGESFESLQKRIHSAIVDIAAQHPNQSIAIFSHGMAIRCARAAFLGLPVEEVHTLKHGDNTAVTLLEFEGETVSSVFSDDNSHLAPEISTFARQTWWKEGQKIALDENLWFEPLDLSQYLYKGLYLAARQEGWAELKRDMSYFWQQPYLERAADCARTNPKHLLCAMRHNTIVGILQLDAARDAAEGIGYISFYYMLPEFRGDRLGIQLLGEAVSVYRTLGRDRLRLSCGEDNVRGMQFYMRHGFYPVGSSEEVFGRLHCLEKYIGFEESRKQKT